MSSHKTYLEVLYLVIEGLAAGAGDLTGYLFLYFFFFFSSLDQGEEAERGILVYRLKAERLKEALDGRRKRKLDEGGDGPVQVLVHKSFRYLLGGIEKALWTPTRGTATRCC